MSLDSRADLDTLADATFTTNGVGGISGAELNDGYKRLAASSVIKDEAGDLGAGLEWASGIIRVAAASVTLAMMANLAQGMIIGRAAAAGTGVPTALSASQVKTILAIDAADITGLSAFATSTDLANATGTLNIARVADGTVTLAKLANLTQAMVIGRASGAGTGVPTALSAAQLSTILGLATIATSGSASDLSTGTVPDARLAGDYSGIANITLSDTLTTPRIFFPTPNNGILSATTLAISAVGSFSDLNLSAGGVLNLGGSIKLNGTAVADIATSGSGADLTNATVTLAKMANLAAATIIGRASGAGTGVPTALSASQVSTILGLATIATSGSASDLSTGTVPNARISGAYTGISDLTVSGSYFGSGAAVILRMNTAAASDTGSAQMWGGGASATRGAGVRAFGVDHASQPGNLVLDKGTGGSIILTGVFTDILVASMTYDPPSTVNNNNNAQNVTVTGATVGSYCIATHTSITTNKWIITAYVSAANTVNVTLFNFTGGTVDLASGTLRVIVFVR